MKASSAAVLAVALLLVLFAGGSRAHDPVTTKVTWSREVQAILSTRCVGCHREGGVAPMSLATYAEARPWARAIRAEVLAGRMPRWPAVRGFGEHAETRGLSPFEVVLLAAWADGGAPEGDERDDTAHVERSARPDAPVRLPARTMPPVGQRRTVHVRARLGTGAWITGWRFFANDPAIVQAEFALDDGRYLGSWVPPEEIVHLPSGAGRWLPRDGGLSVTLWYRSKRLQQDFPVELPSLPPVLGLFVERRGIMRELRDLEASCGETALDHAGEIVSVRPVGAASGALAVALVPPDRPPVPLVRVRDLDPAYLPTYRLQRSAPFAPGSRILVRSDVLDCGVRVEYLH